MSGNSMPEAGGKERPGRNASEGVEPRNSRMLKIFYYQVMGMVHKWLNRRSQRNHAYVKEPYYVYSSKDYGSKSKSTIITELIQFL